MCKKEATYKVAMKALCDNRDNNPTHIKKFFNKFISELKKKNPKWDKITIACVNTLLQGLSSWMKTMMDSMLVLIPKEYSSQSN